MTADSENSLHERLGYAFRDEALLTLALTHRSYCAENDDAESNERLEFLGDAVVGLAVTGYIHSAYPELPEGQLAKLRASVVNTTTLADVAQQIGLGDDLRLGRGEEMSGGRNKESILADAFEAVIGAVYVDSDWERANEIVLECLGEQIAHGAQRPGRLDYKTRLQELTAQLELGSPVYRITGSGPDHDKNFVAVALVQGIARGEGSGTSKKRAEQAAASAAWSALNASHAGEMGESNA
ncbi:MAG: ribonuclease III [Acidimicrobiales bacterium]